MTRGTWYDALRNAAMYMSSQLGARIINFVYFLILARELPPAEFGILNYAVALIVMVDILIDFGLSRHAMREMAKFPHKTNGCLRRLVPYKSVAAILGVAGFGIYALMSGIEPRYAWITFFVAVGLLITSQSMVFENVLQARSQFSTISAAHLVVSIVQFALGAGALWLGADTLVIALVFSLANLSYLAVLLYSVRRLDPQPRIMRPTRRDLRALRLSLPAGFPYLCSALIILLAIRAEFLILGWFGTPVDLAVFGMASKIIEAGLLLPIAWAAVMSPRFAQAHQDGRQALGETYGYALEVQTLLAFPAAAVAFICLPIVPWLLGGGAFAEIDTVIAWMLLGLPAASVFIFNTSILFGAKNQRIPLILLSSLVALQLAVNLVLQSTYGFWGAVAAFVVFMWLAAVISTAAIAWTYAGGRSLRRGLGRPAICLLVAALAVGGAALIGLGPVIPALVGYSVAAAALIGFGGLRRAAV